MSEPASPGIVVEIDDRQPDREVAADQLGRLLVRSLHQLGVTGPAEVGLAFIDTSEMAALNRDHMGGDGPTDVLAFPIDGAHGPAGAAGLGGAVDADVAPAALGDIVICPQVAARAPQPLADELALLVVHGALHLLGHDHAEPAETAIMQGLERDLLAANWS